MRTKRSHVIAAVIVSVVGVLWLKVFWFAEVFHTRKSNEPHRAALLQIRDTVTVGASHAEVLAAYWQHRTGSLSLFADGPADWIITMPMEFGASDWRLLIEFQDGRVSAVRVRTSDGPPPGDGPEDKQPDAGQTSGGAGGKTPLAQGLALRAASRVCMGFGRTAR